VARIAFLIPNLAGGGAERVALTLVGALADRGHEVDLLVMEAVGELAGQVPAGVKLVDLHVKRTRKVLWPLIRYLRKRRPDALQVSMWPLTTVGILATRLARSGTRCVVSDHAVLSDHYARSKHAFLGASVRLFYPLANARVGVSSGAVEDLARLARLDPSMFTVIPNPISFPRKLQRRADVEAMWGDCKSRILTVGQLKPEKDQALLIRAVARLPQSLGAKLMIVGEGNLRDELLALARQEGVEDRLILPGYAADVWPFYASADLFTLSSREESFANVLVEALYAGLPIVSTATIGAASVLDDGKWGRIVPKGDVEALATALAEQLSRKPDAAERRARALELSGCASIDRYEELLLGGASG